MRFEYNSNNVYYVSSDDGNKYAVKFYCKDFWNYRTTKKDGSPLKKPVRERVKYNGLFVDVFKYDDDVNNAYYIDAVLQSYFSGLLLSFTRADMETVLSMLTGVNCEIIGG